MRVLRGLCQKQEDGCDAAIELVNPQHECTLRQGIVVDGRVRRLTYFGEGSSEVP
jgi:hypothetical protein